MKYILQMLFEYHDKVLAPFEERINLMMKQNFLKKKERKLDYMLLFYSWAIN